MSEIIDSTATVATDPPQATGAIQPTAKSPIKAFILKKLVGGGYFLAALAGYLLGGFFLAALMLIAYGGFHTYLIVKRELVLAAAEAKEPVVEKNRKEGKKLPWEYLITHGHIYKARLNTPLVVGIGYSLGILALLLFLGNINGGVSKQLNAMLIPTSKVATEEHKRVRKTINWPLVMIAANPRGIDYTTISATKSDVVIGGEYLKLILENLNTSNRLGVECEQTTMIKRPWIAQDPEVPLCNIKKDRVWLFSLVKSGYNIEDWMVVFVRLNGKWEVRSVQGRITELEVTGLEKYVTPDMVSHALVADFDDIEYLEVSNNEK